MASTQVHRCQHKIQITITKTNVLNSRTALPWKIYWQHGFYQRKYFMSWLQYWELWYYPFSVFQKWSPPFPCLSTTRAGGVLQQPVLFAQLPGVFTPCSGKKCRIMEAWRQRGSHHFAQSVCVCVCFRSPEFTSTWNWGKWGMERWRSTPRCMGV